MSKIAITTECVCDLPDSVLSKINVSLIYYDIVTDNGVFSDTKEVNAENIIEYIDSGSKMVASRAPKAEQFEQFFKERLDEFDEIVHISISDGVSLAYDNACEGRNSLGENKNRVHIVDSMQLSSGLGILVNIAARLRDEGKLSGQEIAKHLEEVRHNVKTSFITRNADYLYYNKRISKLIMKLCRVFLLHPVLYIKDGKLKLKSLYIGNYSHACKSYVSRIIRTVHHIRRENVFVTHVGCEYENIEKIIMHAKSLNYFDNVIATEASATISCNCGPETFGLIYMINA